MEDDDAAPADPAETPIQKALRLKKAALAAKPKQGGRGKFQPGQEAVHAASSKGKPWMTR